MSHPPDLDLRAIGRPCEPLPRNVVELTRDRDPAAAWALAIEQGLLPRSWADDSRRVFPDQHFAFFCEWCNGMGATGYNYDDLCGACRGRGSETVRSYLSSPTTIDALWMIAQPALVESAEQLARDAVRRRGNLSCERVQWGRTREERPGRIPLVIRSPIWDRMPRIVPRPDWQSAVEHTAWWRDLRLDGPTQEMLLDDVLGAWAQRDAGVSDSAFEPLLRLWETGFVFEEILDDRIVLERACRRPRVPSWRAHVPYG